MKLNFFCSVTVLLLSSLSPLVGFSFFDAKNKHSTNSEYENRGYNMKSVAVLTLTIGSLSIYLWKNYLSKNARRDISKSTPEEINVLVASILKVNPLSPDDNKFLETAIPKCSEFYQAILLNSFFEKKEVNKLLLFEKENLERSLSVFQEVNNQLVFSWILSNAPFSQNEKSKILLKAILAGKTDFINLFDEEVKIQVINDNIENDMVTDCFSKCLFRKALIVNKKGREEEIRKKLSCPICYEIMTTSRDPTLTASGYTYCYECLLTCLNNSGEDPLNRQKLEPSKFIKDRNMRNEADEFVKYGR